jgi:hypothetical protein
MISATMAAWRGVVVVLTAVLTAVLISPLGCGNDTAILLLRKLNFEKGCGVWRGLLHHIFYHGYCDAL